jgi:hypothetical protein
MTFSRGVSTEGILKVRELPNGRIDFLNVDESARSLANMMIQTPQLKARAEFENKNE